MSAYIVSKKTIDAIVKGFEIYDVDYMAENYKASDMQELRNSIGQSLLDQNYKSVNHRYSENTPTPKYEYEDVEVNPGVILGCIACFDYQACETDDYFTSLQYISLLNLKNKMLERYIEKEGFEIPWGL